MGKARTSAKPVRLSATSNLHVLSSMPGMTIRERERRVNSWENEKDDRKLAVGEEGCGKGKKNRRKKEREK